VSAISDETGIYDVAVIGYGPTGMMLAALLGANGHRVVVIERYAGLYNLPRAACFDDEIMRTLQKLDLVEEILPGTVVQADYDWVNGQGETLLNVRYDNPAHSGWAALYMMYQPEVEAVLDRRCQALETVDVRQGLTVDGLQNGDVVRIAATDVDGRRHEVRSRYAVGADGGMGFVRSALGIGFSDYGFEEHWLVCDFRERRDLDWVPTFRQVCDPAQPTSIVRIGPGHQRFSFMLEPGETPAQATDPARVWERVSRYISAQDAELIRAANYVFRSRIADRWRQGNVLLAGDAAHEMPPFLGQGMCSGIRDSHNLAWKLDLVLRELADPTVLDTYQPEREPHVRFITEKAIELGRIQTLRDPVAAKARDARMLAAREAHQAPEKIVYPGLDAGLIDPHAPAAGLLLPQARVAESGVRRLLDDVTGPGPLLLARSGRSLTGLGDDSWALWRKLGGHAVVLDGTASAGDARPEADVHHVEDVDGTYTRWFAEQRCEAAVVRPDWYVFGAAPDGNGLADLLVRLTTGLRLDVTRSHTSVPGRATA
jgi:2-polyprenyl-6-methoxyphenol hydroxylase-like FAD-dependent oxidoreductase